MVLWAHSSTPTDKEEVVEGTEALHSVCCVEEQGSGQQLSLSGRARMPGLLPSGL